MRDNLEASFILPSPLPPHAQQFRSECCHAVLQYSPKGIGSVVAEFKRSMWVFASGGNQVKRLMFLFETRSNQITFTMCLFV